MISINHILAVFYYYIYIIIYTVASPQSFRVFRSAAILRRPGANGDFEARLGNPEKALALGPMTRVLPYFIGLSFQRYCYRNLSVSGF